MTEMEEWSGKLSELSPEDVRAIFQEAAERLISGATLNEAFAEAWDSITGAFIATGSTNVAYAAWDPIDEKVAVTFANNCTYDYSATEEEWIAFRKSSSKGRYVNEVFKDGRSYEKVH